MVYEDSRRFARTLDKQDPLREFRRRFHIPTHAGKPAIYFTGNSLGLQPRSVKNLINEELDDWARLGVSGHVHAKRPWIEYHRLTKRALARIVGAKAHEVVAMNGLSVNLHLLMASFYRPTAQRFRIITEAGAFSSDQYILESQLKFHGLDPDTALIELSPRPGECTLRTDDVIREIERYADQLALVFFGAVQYYTGQFFRVKAITEAAHNAGAFAGFDLAHAIGNVPLSLHDDGVDFAAWCSYKYLNSGPGAIAGIFVHDRHAEAVFPRFAGWWGHDEGERFQMKKGFRPMPGADGWQLSNHPIVLAAAHLAALEITREAGMRALRKKSVQLTGYLEYLLNIIDPDNRHYSLLTPSAKEERGCQLSVYMKHNGRKIFQQLSDAGVVADWREPNVIRLAPVPLYNTFEDVHRFSDIFRSMILG